MGYNVGNEEDLQGYSEGGTSQGEKAAVIERLAQEGYQVSDLLKASGLPRSTYYYEIRKEDAVLNRNRKLMEMIKEIYEENKGRYGVRRICAELHKRGHQVNHKRVQRLMNQNKLFGKCPKEKYHSYKGEVGKIAENIINRDFRATAPYQKLTTDVTQFKFSWGKCYLSPVLDMYTNEIIGYDLSQSPNLKQISTMLERTFEKIGQREGIIFHSDQGWQYQHELFRNELSKHGMIQSMSRRGNCYDNCIVETFFGWLKNEMFYGHEREYHSFEEFKQTVDEYIDYYNNKRIQIKTKWMPPVIYRNASMC